MYAAQVLYEAVGVLEIPIDRQAFDDKSCCMQAKKQHREHCP